MADRTGKTKWHLLLGGLLERVLPPVGITVQTEIPIMNKPPRVDILLLRREEGDRWTPEQYGRLPDGIRDSKANHILLEFKYSESINKTVLQKMVGYYVFYRTVQQLKEADVFAFILSSRTPNKEFLRTYAYQAGDTPGIYYSVNPLLTHTAIIALNELRSVEHNAFVKFFASRKNEREQAFFIMQSGELQPYSQETLSYVSGLQRYWSVRRGEDEMLDNEMLDNEFLDIELTPERVIKIGEAWRNAWLNTLSPEERLAGLRPEDRLAGLRPEDRLAGLRPEDRLAGLRLEERLAGLTRAEIEGYLRHMRQSNGKDV